MYIPHHAGIEVGIDAAAIDQHLYLGGELTVEAADGNGPFVRGDAGNLDAGNQTQGIREIGRVGTADIVIGQHIDHRRGVGKFLRFFCRCSYDQIQGHQFLQTEFGDFDILFAGPGCSRCVHRGHDQ